MRKHLRQDWGSIYNSIYTAQALGFRACTVLTASGLTGFEGPVQRIA